MSRSTLHRSALRILGAALLAAPLLGGCESNQASREALAAENAELRDQNEQLSSLLSNTEQRYDSLSAERTRLISENDSLRSQLGQMSRRADTGFGNMPGVSVERRAGEIVVEVAGDVLFSSGSASLRSSAKSTLDSIADVIKRRYGGNEIRIAGHTDSDPIRKSKWKTNERLSAERALAVEQYLASKGVSGSQMHVAAYGPANPKASKKESRRVEIIILES